MSDKRAIIRRERKKMEKAKKNRSPDGELQRLQVQGMIDGRIIAASVVLEILHDKYGFRQKRAEHVSTIKRGEKEYNDGWIPCSEKFPDNESYILLSFDNFSVPCVGRYKQDESGGAFYIGDDDETCISQELYVNAWQPLPEPFTEKKQ